MGAMTLGAEGERVAAAYLRSRGYRILDRNWEVRGKNGALIGELDIVAEQGGDIAVVEVKAGQSSDPAWRPEINLDDAKLEKVVKAAERWLLRNGGLERPWQVDLVAVDFSKEPPAIRHYCHVN